MHLVGSFLQWSHLSSKMLYGKMFLPALWHWQIISFSKRIFQWQHTNYNWYTNTKNTCEQILNRLTNMILIHEMKINFVIIIEFHVYRTHSDVDGFWCRPCIFDWQAIIGCFVKATISIVSLPILLKNKEDWNSS